MIPTRSSATMPNNIRDLCIVYRVYINYYNIIIPECKDSIVSCSPHPFSFVSRVSSLALKQPHRVFLKGYAPDLFKEQCFRIKCLFCQIGDSEQIRLLLLIRAFQFCFQPPLQLLCLVLADRRKEKNCWQIFPIRPTVFSIKEPDEFSYFIFPELLLVFAYLYFPPQKRMSRAFPDIAEHIRPHAWYGLLQHQIMGQVFNHKCRREARKLRNRHHQGGCCLQVIYLAWIRIRREGRC